LRDIFRGDITARLQCIAGPHLVIFHGARILWRSVRSRRVALRVVAASLGDAASLMSIWQGGLAYVLIGGVQDDFGQR
jgi:hypothetical protein